MQNFLPTTNTTPGYLAFNYFTPGSSPGFDEIRNDKEVAFSIEPVQQNQQGAPNAFVADYEPGDEFSMAIGNFDDAPTAGVFSLQVGATTSGLANLTYNISASALQTALNAALTTEGKPNCVVLLAADGAYLITGATNGAITDGFFAVLSDAGLYPISNAFFTKGSNGSVSTPYRYTLTLRQAPMCYAEPTDALPTADVTVEPTQNQAAGQSVVRTILFTVPQVSAGSYLVNATANGTEGTCGTATPYMSAREFGLLLANHSQINYATPNEDDNISVTSSANSQVWVVTAIGDLFDDATFEIVATNNPDKPLVGPMGLSGSINYNTYGLYVYSLGQADTFTLTRQIQRTRGSETRTLYSGEVTIFKELIDASTAVPTPTINYYTAAQVDALLLDKMDTDAGNAVLPDALNNLLPSQTGNAGKVLKTDGTDASWQTDSGSLNQYAELANDQNLTSSTAFVDVTGMSLSLPSGTYRLSVLLVLTAGGSAPGFSCQLALSNSCRYNYTASYGQANGGASVDYATAGSATTIGLGALGGVTQFSSESTTTLVVTTTTTVKVQFAQQSSSATAITMIAQSSMLATKVA